MHNISTSVDKIGGISAKQIFGGLRQTPLLWYQSSFSNSESGLQFSNSLHELPQSIGEMSKQVNTIEDILWYLLTGHIGTPQSSTLQIIFSRVRTDISKSKNEVNVMLDTIQKDTPILTQLSLALLSLQHRSVHRKAYFTSSKKELWRSTLVDVLEIWNILPYICGTIHGENIQAVLGGATPPLMTNLQVVMNRMRLCCMTNLLNPSLYDHTKGILLL